MFSALVSTAGHGWMFPLGCSWCLVVWAGRIALGIACGGKARSHLLGAPGRVAACLFCMISADPKSPSLWILKGSVLRLPWGEIPGKWKMCSSVLRVSELLNPTQHAGQHISAHLGSCHLHPGSSTGWAGSLQHSRATQGHLLLPAVSVPRPSSALPCHPVTTRVPWRRGAVPGSVPVAVAGAPRAVRGRMGSGRASM